jgi:hypothetical protein
VVMVACWQLDLEFADSDPAENDGFLRVIKIRSAHFRRRGGKAVGPMS